MANGETAVKVVAALATVNPVAAVAVAGAGAVVFIGCAIACKIVTRCKSVKFNVGDVFNMEAEFH